jgi:hypothetical protein
MVWNNRNALKRRVVVQSVSTSGNGSMDGPGFPNVEVTPPQRTFTQQIMDNYSSKLGEDGVGTR